MSISMGSVSKLAAILLPNFVAIVNDYSAGANSNLSSGTNREFVPLDSDGSQLTPLAIKYLFPSSNTVAISYQKGANFRVGTIEVFARNKRL